MDFYIEVHDQAFYITFSVLIPKEIGPLGVKHLLFLFTTYVASLWSITFLID